jgi:hypothetical protein
MTTRLWAYFLSKKLYIIFALVQFLDFRPPLFVVAWQEEKLPFAFYINDKELSSSLGAHLLQNKGASISLLLNTWRLVKGLHLALNLDGELVLGDGGT